MISQYLLIRKTDNLLIKNYTFHETWSNKKYYFLHLEYEDGTTEFELPEDPYNEYDMLIFNLTTPLTQEELDADNVIKTISDGTWNHTLLLDSFKSHYKAKVKAEANRRITGPARDGDTGDYTNMPEWKQRNYSARSLELVRIEAEGGTLTSEQETELNAIDAIWGRIKAIRTASDTIETDIDAAADHDAVAAIDIQGNTNWPAAT